MVRIGLKFSGRTAHRRWDRALPLESVCGCKGCRHNRSLHAQGRRGAKKVKLVARRRERQLRARNR